jgi:hypothetical protein
LESWPGCAAWSGAYAQAFRDGEVTPDAFSELTDKDLRELRLPLVALRHRVNALRPCGRRHIENLLIRRTGPVWVRRPHRERGGKDRRCEEEENLRSQCLI